MLTFLTGRWRGVRIFQYFGGGTERGSFLSGKGGRLGGGEEGGGGKCLGSGRGRGKLSTFKTQMASVDNYI